MLKDDEDEHALVRYAAYMANNRYPVSRSQVIGLAWAIALQHGKECFNQSTGPSLHWWRGFKRRNPGLTLRKPESVDQGRVSNATPEIIGDYFDTLESTLVEHGLVSKPDQIYNCDEAAVFLNKSTQKALVPVKSKHCHTQAHGTNQHIFVLCCISAGGSYLPPLIIFSK